jgi:hypothetical protein
MLDRIPVKNKKILTILGTRPEIIRLSRIIPKLDQLCDHRVLHTGQNYDPTLNEIFFNDLGIRQPDVILDTKGTTAEQIGKMFVGVEKYLQEFNPDKVHFIVSNESIGSIAVLKPLLKNIQHSVHNCDAFDFFAIKATCEKIIDKIEVDGIPLSIIKDMTTDKSSVYFFDKLIKRYLVNDTTLKQIDYTMLYYGYVFQPQYNPYKHKSLEDSLATITEKKDGYNAIKVANMVLSENPFSLVANVEKAYTAHAFKKPDYALVNLYRYNKIVETILASGKGDSYENPLVVTSPNDANVFMTRYNLIVISKTLNGENSRWYDVYLVKNKDNKEYPIYFDITLARTIGMEKLLKK